jgi:hypothetical protein
MTWEIRIGERPTARANSAWEMPDFAQELARVNGRQIVRQHRGIVGEAIVMDDTYALFRPTGE